MKYANWANENDIKKVLKEISLKDNIEKSGIPIINKNGNLYIDDKNGHTLVIGSTGSGKTQTTILPIMKLAMKAGENIVVHDSCGELYKTCAANLEKNGYNVLVLDLENAIHGNNWNPLTLPYQLYKKENKDKGIQCIENIAYYLVHQEKYIENVDPFWEMSAIDLFTGVTLYLFDNEKEDVNLKDICSTINNLATNEYCTEFLNKLDKKSPAHTYLSATLSSAAETRQSIIAVLLQKLKLFVARTNLSNMMEKSDFDIAKISNNKTAIFMITGNSLHSTHLTPLFIDQVITSIELYSNKEKRTNLLLDEFDNMIPIQNFAKIISFLRTINVRLTVLIKSFTDLIHMYGKEDSEIIKMCFSNIIYLLSNDFYTLEKISKLCGMQDKDTPLVSIEELKTINTFEAIVIMPRQLPFKTLLTPDYKIDWGFDDIKKDLPPRQ